MIDRSRDKSFPALACGLPDHEVMEVPLLLFGWQVSQLETVAHQRGLTAGEMVRHLLRDFIASLPAREEHREVAFAGQVEAG